MLIWSCFPQLGRPFLGCFISLNWYVFFAYEDLQDVSVTLFTGTTMLELQPAVTVATSGGNKNSPGHFSHSRHSCGVLKLKCPCGCCHAKATPTFPVLSVWQWGAHQRFCCLDARFCDPALRGVAQNQTSEVSIWLALPLVLPPARSRSFRLVIQSYLEHFRRLFLNRVPKLCQCQEKH